MQRGLTCAFQVWAPLAKRVEVQIGEKRLSMTVDDKGWWRTVAQSEQTEVDYCFYLDGSGSFPDPRSPCQPLGVHGPSRMFAHSTFPWSDSGWEAPPLSAAVVYEMHIGTYTHAGTFQAAIEKLSHLAKLGVTHIEVMPVNSFPGDRGWGYDGVDLFAPHQPYGGPEGFKRFVDACHRRGMGVVLDVVYNHFGPSGNYWGRFGPYFSHRASTPWGPAINLDGPDSDEVRRFFCDNALMWLRDYHVDGLRLDAVHEYFDRSALPFLEQLGNEVRNLEARLGRRLVITAENDLNDPRALYSHDQGGFGLHAQWNDDFHHALHSVLTGESNGYYQDFGSIGDLCAAFRSGYVYDGRYSRHRRRRHGRPAVGLNGHRFVAYAQNHDQVGNRAKGERSAVLMSQGRLKIAAALVLLSPFVPMIFQGEEWGATAPFLYFADHSEPDLQKAVRNGRRREFSAFGWRPEEIPDPQDPKTFERSKLDWSEPERKPHSELLEWSRQLIEVRRSEPHLGDGRLDLVRTRHDEARRWLVVERGPVGIACNLAGETQVVPMGDRCGSTLLASLDGVAVTDGEVRLPPDSVAIVRLR
jgi:maltooligosyltrehalose trehalohydrolase